MKKSKTILVAFLSFTFFQSSSYGFEVGLMGGGKYDSVGSKITAGSSSGELANTYSGHAYGIELGQSLIPGILGLELDILRLTRTAGFNVGSGLSIEAAISATQIPAIARILALGNFQPGIGIYYLKSDANPPIIYGTGGASDWPPLKFKTSEIGYLLSLKFQFEIFPMFSLFADGRYQWSGKTVNEPGDLEFTIKELIGLVGVSFSPF